MGVVDLIGERQRRTDLREEEEEGKDDEEEGYWPHDREIWTGYETGVRFSPARTACAHLNVLSGVCFI